jgi:hypothetical protein
MLELVDTRGGTVLGQLHRRGPVRPTETHRGPGGEGCYLDSPIYRGLAAKGLIRKDYLNGDAGAGGVYLWETRALAEAWFTEDRIVDLTRRFGVRPRLSLGTTPTSQLTI